MKLPKVPQSARRVITATAVGAAAGYAASKGMFIDPAITGEALKGLAASLPDTSASVGTGAALGGAAMGAYEAGKHRALGKQFKNC